jgi:ABC-2 type transport system ATP-binding protein
MIQVDGLTKYYGEHAAIRDLTFEIARGEVIGFLGLNGAGKTTTLKVLGCVLLPTSGRVTIDGYDVVKNPHEIRKRIGFLPDTPPLYDEMTVRGYLSFVAQLRGVAAKDVPARVRLAEEQAALVEVDGEIVGSLSHGYRQRVGVAQALVHNPELLILDEPSSGLDPVQIVEMRALIRSLKGQHTILVSSHILSEISQTCDRLLIIQEGEIAAQGSEQELAARLGSGGHVEIEVRGAPERAAALVRAVPGVASASVLRTHDGVSTLRVEGASELRPEIARALVSGGIDLLRLDRSTEKLESIFLRLTQQDRQEREAQAA